jgi:lipopolysaccharide transport system ATP-binding protein
MSDSIIEVKGLCKKYILSHEGQEKYTALRDVITNKVKGLVNKQQNLKAPSQEEFWALKDVEFNIKQGDRVGIIGRNGAGKSTLLKILSRITEPTSGSIKIKGRVASLLEVGTGFHPELTGRENIFLNGAILGMSRTEICKKFDEIVDFAEVERFLDTPVKRYSSGMYVRLAFAIAAHLEPEILIVDEVLAVGDSNFQKKCLGKMEDVSKVGGRTVLFVSHNMGTIIQLCNNTILLNGGAIQRIGNTSDIVQEYYNLNQSRSNLKIQKQSDAYLSDVYTCDNNGNLSQYFAHKEDINIRIVVNVKKYSSVQQIALCLLRSDKKRVFTVSKLLSEYISNDSSDLIIQFKIKGGLIAPSEYSFLVTINSSIGAEIFDWHEDICQIKVYDDGTPRANEEGYDYGCIIINEDWKRINN